jgi:hypothetical protein
VLGIERYTLFWVLNSKHGLRSGEKTFIEMIMAPEFGLLNKQTILKEQAKKGLPEQAQPWGRLPWGKHPFQ